MNEQVYGIFSSVVNAEQAISALKDHGVDGNEISVVHRSDGSGIPEIENVADHAITPTSAGDVVAGAMKGGAVGLALGIIGSAIALTIPGIGPILAAGPLAAAFGSTLLTTAAGAISGGAVGFFVDQGIPEEAAARYNDALNRGDILVAVRSDHVSTADTVMLMNKYGAVATENHPLGDTLTGALEPPIIDREADIEGAAAPTVVTVVTTPAPTTMATLSPSVSVPAERVDPVREP